MRKFHIATFILASSLFFQLCICRQLHAQELPDLNQRLIKSVVYNPSLAGLNGGNISLVYKNYWGNINDAPNTALLSIQAPFAGDHVGLGLNYFNDQVNFLTTNYVSAFAAYRLIIKDASVSFGVSGEYDNTKIDYNKIDVRDGNDLTLLDFKPQNDLDVSFGMNFKYKFINFGGTVNRLMATIQNDTSKWVLPSFYSGHVQGVFTINKHRDQLLPTFTYRNTSTSNGKLGQWDLGLYYTYNELLTFEASYGAHGKIAGQFGVEVDGIFINYTFDTYNDNTIKSIGNSHEIWVGYNFLNSGYKSEYLNDYEKTKKAISFRRKSKKKGFSFSNINSRLKSKNKNKLNPNKKFEGNKIYNKSKKKSK